MAHPLASARKSWVLGACLLLPAAVAAEEPGRSPAVHPGDAAESDPLRQGRQARTARRWAEAEAALEAALEPDRAGRLTPLERAEVMGEIGLCELSQGKHREAAEHLSRSLDHFSSLRPAVGMRFNKALAEALKHVGWVFFSADPPDAAILLDGKPVRRAGVSYELFVDPGKHTIRARLNGYQDVVQVFDIDAGQKHQLSMHLPKAPSPAASVAAVKPKAAASQAATPKAKASSAASGWPWLPLRIAGGVLSVGALVTGGILLSRADATLEELQGERDALWASAQPGGEPGAAVWANDVCFKDPRRSGCSVLSDLRTQEYTLRTAGWVTVGAGSVLGALTLSSFLLTRGRPAMGQLMFGPMLAGRQTGIALMGTW